MKVATEHAAVPAASALLAILHLRPVLRRPGPAALLALVALMAGVWSSDIFEVRPSTSRLVADDHGAFMLEIALVAKHCSTAGTVDESTQLLGIDPIGLDVPLTDAIIAKHGSIERFCDRSTRPAIINEMGHYLVLKALLELPPEAETARTLALKLAAFRCLLLWAILFALASFGAGILPLGIVAFFGANAVAAVQATHHLSIYATLPVLPALGGVVAVGLVMASTCRTTQALAAGFVCGLIIGFILNYRTTYGALTMGLLILAFAVHAFWTRPVPWRRHALGLLAASTGFLGFLAALIWPLQHAQTDGPGHARHPVWHSLVLGLALPAHSELTRREGIEYRDAVGHEIAKRLEPTVVYLGPVYDEVLRRYYFDLWRNHPEEMLAIYQGKLQALWQNVTFGLIAVLGSHTPPGPAWRKAFLESELNGALWLVLLLGGGLAAASCYRLSAPLALAATSMMAAVFCLSVEQIAITSVFALSHQAALPVCLIASVALCLSLAGAVLGKLSWFSRTRPGG